MKPDKLPYDKFIETFKYVPRLAVNILAVNNKGEVLLTKRSIKPFKGFWHFPGSFLLKGETLFDCAQRVAREELGLNIDRGKLGLAGVFDDLDGDPRGQIVDVIYQIEVNQPVNLKPTSETSELRFFKKFPSKVGFNHHETLARLGYR